MNWADAIELSSIPKSGTTQDFPRRVFSQNLANEQVTKYTTYHKAHNAVLVLRLSALRFHNSLRSLEGKMR